MELKIIVTLELAARLAPDEHNLSDRSIPLHSLRPSGTVSVFRNLEIGVPVPKGTALLPPFVRY
jgi:hypothetical protein